LEEVAGVTYRIREVDASDEEITDHIHRLNRQTMEFPELTEDELEGPHCYWWLAYHGVEVAGFAGMIPSSKWHNVAYFKRAGVDPKHRGNGLQIRLMRVRISKARKLGYSHLISECTETIWSANNFIKAGFKLYEPRNPWAFKNSLYWIKAL
jgi:GNAT superfamily N-acetyltransferase